MRKSKPLHSRKAQRGFNARTINCISAHEDKISSTIKASVNRSEQICQRLENFERSFQNDKKQDDRIQWIRDYNTLRREIDVLSKSIMTGSMDGTTKSILNLQLDEGCMLDLDSGIYRRIKNFVLDVCCKKNKDKITCSRNQNNCRTYHDFCQAMKEENESLNEYQEKLERGIKSHKTSFMDHDRSAMEEFQIQIARRKVNETKEKLQDICNYSKDVGLINPKIYHDLSRKIEIIVVDFTEMDRTAHRRDKMVVENSNLSILNNDEKDTTIIENQGRTTLANRLVTKTQNWNCVKDSTKLVQKTENIHKLIDKFDILSEQISEQIWKCAISLANAIILDEKQFRFDLVNKLKKCAVEIQSVITQQQHYIDQEKEKKLKQRRDKNRLKAKVKIEKHRFLQDVKQMERKKLEQKRVLLAEEEKQKRMVENIKRVQFRQRELTKKNERLEEAMAKKDEEKMDRMKSLEKLATSVPYHHSIMTKKADLTKSTAARDNDIFEPSCCDDLRDFQQGPQKLKCFTDEKIFSDPKFRLAHALHESGKANTAYSLAVVRQIIPRSQERTTGIDPN